jgi:hypothetical protein
MIEILHFKKGAKIIKLKAAVTNLNVWAWRGKHTEKNRLTG